MNPLKIEADSDEGFVTAAFASYMASRVRRGDDKAGVRILKLLRSPEDGDMPYTTQTPSELHAGARVLLNDFAFTSGVIGGRQPEEPTRRYEGAAVMDPYALGFLRVASQENFLPPDEVMEFSDSYDGLRAVLKVAQAEWVVAGPRGVHVTERGRDRARRMFRDCE